jgi:hypothetical protein
MMKKNIDIKSFLIGGLSVIFLVTFISAASDNFSQDEITRLRRIASYVQPDGNLNIGNKKIIMLGSSIYDDGSQDGGLIIRGGADRVHIHGNAIIYDNPEFKRDTINLNSNLNMGNKKIIMLGSSIYDDGSQGGGLILRGGANRINMNGNAIIYDGVEFKRDTINFNANLDMGNKSIIMIGSRIYDDGSEGGGLQLRGGANRIHFFGQTISH